MPARAWSGGPKAWLLSFGRQKKVTRLKATCGMQNVKEKMRNVKVAAVHFWSVCCVENPGDIPFEWTTNTASEGSGISRWAVKKLAGMEWPHRILFEPDQRTGAKKSCQTIQNTGQKLKSEGEFILCNGMQGNFRHRCVAGAFSLVTFFWAPKESDKNKGNVRNAKCKRKNYTLSLHDALSIYRKSVV